MSLVKKLRSDPGLSYSLADVFLYAQIPNLFVSIPATAALGYVFFRSTATGTLAQVVERFERPTGKIFALIHPYIPFLNKISLDQLQKDKKGSAAIMLGMVQYATAIGSFVTALIHPTNPIAWLAMFATGFFSAFNIKLGLQLNNPETIKADVRWRDVLQSPPLLDAAGACCSGLMAGLATSFGWGATLPIALALFSAALIATGKIGKARLNTGVPMGVMTAVAVLFAVVGVVNGRWLAAISNAFAANGELIVSLFYNQSYQEARLKAPPQNRAGKFLQHLYIKA